MEAPLSVHEFLKRYHLPQLVRLHWPSQEHLAQQNCNKQAGKSSLTSSVQVQASNSNGSSNKKYKRPHEKSDWTYRAGNGGSMGAARSQIELNRNLSDAEDAAYETFKSMLIGRRRENLRPVTKSTGTVWPQEYFRVPRASLAKTSANNLNDIDAPTVTKSVGLVKTKAHCQHVDEKKQECQQIGASIKLVPIIKWPTMAKLNLEQPFLLYKAYKKLELCAYVVDTKNELSEKSGDPIYFPHNYTGKFTFDLFKNRKWALHLVSQYCAVKM